MISNPAGNPDSLGGCVSPCPLSLPLLSCSYGGRERGIRIRAAGESDRSGENQPVYASAAHHPANWRTGCLLIQLSDTKLRHAAWSRGRRTDLKARRRKVHSSLLEDPTRPEKFSLRRETYPERSFPSTLFASDDGIPSPTLLVRAGESPPPVIHRSRSHCGGRARKRGSSAYPRNEDRE